MVLTRPNYQQVEPILSITSLRTMFHVKSVFFLLPGKGTTLFTATDPLKENYNLPEITVGTIKAADGETDLYYRLIKLLISIRTKNIRLLFTYTEVHMHNDT